MGEVEVYVKDEDVPTIPEVINVAGEGTASQSSMGWGGVASRAIDGKTNGQWSGRSCTHSRYNKNNWWKLEFDSPVSVNAVKIYNRMDCCQNRINGAEVYAGEVLCGKIEFNFQSSYT